MHTSPTPIIIVTGYPATGKTTLAQRLASELSLPLLWKDGFKETLAESLGWSTDEWSRKLGIASWALLYQQVETLAAAGVAFVVEGNFDPIYATMRWQQVCARYSLRILQIRCETKPETLLARFQARITRGERHPVHRDQDSALQRLVHQGPLGWIEVEGERLAVDTTNLPSEQYLTIAATVRTFLSR